MFPISLPPTPTNPSPLPSFISTWLYGLMSSMSSWPHGFMSSWLNVVMALEMLRFMGPPTSPRDPFQSSEQKSALRFNLHVVLPITLTLPSYLLIYPSCSSLKPLPHPEVVLSGPSELREAVQPLQSILLRNASHLKQMSLSLPSLYLGKHLHLHGNVCNCMHVCVLVYSMCLY